MRSGEQRVCVAKLARSLLASPARGALPRGARGVASSAGRVSANLHTISRGFTMKKQQGFTLIELMIVVAIIAILAAIAIPAYQDYIARAQMSEALTLASGQKVGVSEVFSNKGTCPANGSDGFAADTDINGKYVQKVTVGGTAAASGGCTIVATMKSTGVSTGVQGATLTLTLSNADKGSNVWTCTSSAKQKYLPTACTGGTGA